MKNKKKFLWITLIVLVIIPAYSQQYDSERDFQVEREGNGVVITGYIGSKTVVNIPPRIQNRPVIGIGYYAFSSRDSLTSLVIPSSVNSIRDFAFYGCTGLTSITIPNSVTNIGDNAFGGCNSITAINVDAANTAYISQDGVLYNKNKTTLIQYPVGKKALSFTIPNSVINIGDSAFSNCSSLTSVSISDSVTSIGNGVFAFCKNLASVTIPNSTKSIGESAFDNCTSLNRVIIPDSVTSIGVWAFRGCGLTSVTIGKGVTSIGSEAFADLQNLTSVTFLGTIPLSGFSVSVFYSGDLYQKYRAGGPGTYTKSTTGPGGTWTKQK